MSLHTQMIGDLTRIFMNLDEFATLREFRIQDGLGGFLIFNKPVVWDVDTAKASPIFTPAGLIMCDVRCYIRASDLPRVPLAEEIIYSPANQQWKVLACTIAEGLYEMPLIAYRSSPAMFGT